MSSKTAYETTYYRSAILYVGCLIRFQLTTLQEEKKHVLAAECSASISKQNGEMLNSELTQVMQHVYTELFCFIRLGFNVPEPKPTPAKVWSVHMRSGNETSFNVLRPYPLASIYAHAKICQKSKLLHVIIC